MVRFGDAFVELSAVEAIAPVRDGCGYAVFLTGGRIMNLDVTEEEVIQVLVDNGYLELMEAAPLVVEPALTVPERAELNNAYLRGFRFAAKDESGLVFAFTSRPRKGRSAWLNDDDTSGVVRLRNGFNGLSFTDEAPLELAYLFVED